MVIRATGINPAMLRWARERAGYSIEEIARRRRVPADRVLEWEDGRSYPTWKQLEKLAGDDYHRPPLFFFLDEPPAEKSLAAEFRRLPEASLADLHPDTRYAVRQARARQLDLAELVAPPSANEPAIVRDLGKQADAGNPAALAATARAYFDVSLDEQKSWRHIDTALNEWRNRVENAGVWVFKRSFRQGDVAGFCMNGSPFPVIYLNNGQAKSRQIFTLFHELAHLLFDFNYLERLDEQHYISELSDADRAVERACNRFAAAFLVPDDEFRRDISGRISSDVGNELITSLANAYLVSREVILRKFLYLGWLDSSEYQGFVNLWKEQNTPSQGGGGNYYATQATYLGKKYLRAAFLAYDEGRIDDVQLADCLGVKGSNLGGLERYAWQ